MELLDGNENAEIVSQILLWSRSMGDSSHLVNKSKWSEIGEEWNGNDH